MLGWPEDAESEVGGGVPYCLPVVGWGGGFGLMRLVQLSWSEATAPVGGSPLWLNGPMGAGAAGGYGCPEKIIKYVDLGVGGGSRLLCHGNCAWTVGGKEYYSVALKLRTRT